MQTIPRPETSRLVRREGQNHIKQALHTKEGWLLMYKTIFKENIDKVDGEIWKITQNRILEDLQSNVEDETDNNQAETDQEKANKGRSRIQELNPSPIPEDQGDSMTLYQDTSIDDQ
jgi:hypothetical protein